MTDVRNDAAYFEFEQRFRGTREMILGRLAVYRPLLERLGQARERKAALDLGCGRGEWLETLGAAGWDATGIDLNEHMLAACRALNLRAQQAEAVAHLGACAPGSLDLVSAFHLVEHLPFDALLALIRAAHEALAPGGGLVFETPNPENLAVGTCGFYMDPTHVRPLPPELLQFLVTQAGFEATHVVRLNGQPNTEGTLAAVLSQPLACGPDYAVIAVKAPAPDTASWLADYARHTGQPAPTAHTGLPEVMRQWNAMEAELRTLRTEAAHLTEAVHALKREVKALSVFREHALHLLNEHKEGNTH